MVEHDIDYARRALDHWAKEHPDEVGSAHLRVRLADDAKDDAAATIEGLVAAYARHGHQMPT